jgi:hypothetical protein
MKLRTLFLFIILLFAVYQDFPLINYFGEIARTPIIFITPFFLLYFFKNKKIHISEYSKIFIFYILYLLLISIIYSIYIIIKNKSIYVFDENILIKNIKMLFYPTCALLFYLFIYNFLKRTKDLNQVFQPIYCIQLLLIIILLFEVKYYKTTQIFLPYLHSSIEKYWRLRLLTFESSWSGSIVVIFTFFPIFLADILNKKKSTKILILLTSVFFFIYYTLHSESKGYLMLVLISLLPMLIKYIYQNKKTRKFLYISIIPILVVGFLVFSYLKDQIIEHLYTSITFGTRFTGYLASLETFIMNPFGVGFGPYLEIYTHHIESVTNKAFMQKFELAEVKNYLLSPQFLSSKTYFFDHLVFGGVSFLLFFYLFFIKRYSKLVELPKAYILKMILIYLILSGVFYLTFNIKYEIWFFLAFIDYYQNKKYEQV